MSSIRASYPGMKWYKFLIYFSLFAGALLNFLYGIVYMTGGIYEVSTDGRLTAEKVYGYYGGTLKTVDIVFGLILIAIAIFALIVRSKLASFDYNAPKCLYIFYIGVGGGQLLYAIATSIITKTAITMTEIIKILIEFVFLFANYRYFKNRAHLFISDIPVEPACVPTTSFSYETAEQCSVDASSKETKPATFSLSFPDEKPTAHGNYHIRGSDVLLEQPNQNYLFTSTDKPAEKKDKEAPHQSADVTPAEYIPEIRFCRKCGSKVVPSSHFCSQCGTEI